MISSAIWNKQALVNFFKTINKLCNDIFTSLRCKKVQGIVQSVSESLSMKWNRRFRGLTMFVFSFRRWIARAKC